MFVIRSDALQKRSKVFRYIYFLISGFRFCSPSNWVRDGEPNPFVRALPRNRITHQQEIEDIFEDSLGRR
ncbi:hypothetical protein [Silicimonas sp. MF1-12-2]|uniref:hypothetical protein n=1 Tax=Silicimonas sp. MF1-12-2 TaxID=3384793 RepID=UPI0039B55E2A